VPSSIQVMKFSSHFVHVGNDTDDNYFNWGAFQKAVSDYKGDDLTFDKFKSNRINQSESTVKVMVDKIVAFLRDVLSILLPESEILALAATIESTFTNLKNAQSNGWADFSKSKSGENSSWEYRVLFAFPNPDLPDFFYSLVTTIKLEANIKEESSWWGLVGSSSRNFSAQIDAMELVVLKGFKDPIN